MKHIKFLALPILLVPLIHGLSPVHDVCAVPPDIHWRGDMGKQCKEEQSENGSHVKCCWKEPVLDSILVHEYCQTCRSVDGKGAWECEPKLKSIGIPPMFGEDSSTGRGEALVQPEHSQPGGKNVGVPQSGSTEQPATTSTQQNPSVGANAPTQGGSTIQLPPQTGSSVASENSQGESSSGIIPPTNDQSSGGTTAEQPQIQQPQKDGQEEPSNEGQSTTAPVT